MTEEERGLEQLQAASVQGPEAAAQQSTFQMNFLKQEVLDLHEARRSDELVVVTLQKRLRELMEVIQSSRSELQNMRNQHNAFLIQQSTHARSIDLAVQSTQTQTDIYRELKAAHMKVGAHHLQCMTKELT